MLIRYCMFYCFKCSSSQKCIFVFESLSYFCLMTANVVFEILIVYYLLAFMLAISFKQFTLHTVEYS